MDKKLLIVAHAPSANIRILKDAVIRGAQHADVHGVAVQWVPPLEATAADVLDANAILLGTPENFAFMSGALKDFFDRIYYPCLEQTEALPYALFVRAGSDGTGACNSVERIVTGLKWRAVQPPLVMRGEFKDTFICDCEELGMTMAAGLEVGLF